MFLCNGDSESKSEWLHSKSNIVNKNMEKVSVN